MWKCKCKKLLISRRNELFRQVYGQTRLGQQVYRMFDLVS